MNSPNRHVRVFVSSTFYDLQSERELLTRETFPLIREEMAARQVTVSEVDLRWGITVEAAQQGKVLQICLDEIDRCRPYFIGIVGSRYGSKVDIDEETQAAFGWLREARGRSITEIEFLHGALNAPETSGRSLFYIRADAEEPQAPPELKALVQRVGESGLPLRRGWREPEELAVLVTEDLRRFLHEDFPDEVLDPAELAAAQHAHFAAHAGAGYAAGAENLDRLRRQVESDDPPLVVTGVAGGGKTALLAQFSGSQPFESTFVHFAGSVAGSTDPLQLMRRLLTWLAHMAAIEIDLDVPATDLAAGLDAAFARLPAGKRITAIIDSVDLLDDLPEARLFVWLPRRPPPAVRLIVSCQSQDVLDAASRRGWPVHSLAPLSVDQRERIAQLYLQPHGKSLDRSQLQRVIDTPQAGNLLFLQTVLNELKIFGVFDRLDAQLTQLLSYEDTEALLNHILARLDEEDDAGYARSTLESLSLSHSGLTEDELLRIVESSGTHAQLTWAAVRRTLEAHIVDQAGRFRISSHALRKALSKRYLADRNDEALGRARRATSSISVRTCWAGTTSMSRSAGECWRRYWSNVRTLQRSRNSCGTLYRSMKPNAGVTIHRR